MWEIRPIKQKPRLNKDSTLPVCGSVYSRLIRFNPFSRDEEGERRVLYSISQETLEKPHFQSFFKFRIIYCAVVIF